MDIQKKLTNIKDFVNNILTTVYGTHNCIIGNIFITNFETYNTEYSPGLGMVSMNYMYGPHREILKLSPTGEVYYDNLIIDIFKSINVEYVPGMRDSSYWYVFNLNNTNDKIIELRNYSDEELKLYFKLS